VEFFILIIHSLETFITIIETINNIGGKEILNVIKGIQFHVHQPVIINTTQALIRFFLLIQEMMLHGCVYSDSLLVICDKIYKETETYHINDVNDEL